MGVKYLWTVLSPFCDRKPLYELQGKKVAVDLSCWICEAQNIAEYQVQPRMYLRNLYFRTCYLLLMDVNPVFVLEGKAPELKYDTISARNAVQFKGARPKSEAVKTGKDRTRFHFVLRQCEEMLSYMGLACLKGNGEAESLCAYLNEVGLVDGCISQDSDCFAYGAQVVYRNFSISTQGAQTASGGAVDVYDIRKANDSLGFGRNKIVAMALLVGCDYTEGVHGVGKDSVLKFFETVSDDEVLNKLRSWRENNLYENYEKQLSDKNICSSCGHGGKIQSHTKNGCASCRTAKGCDPFKFKNERLNMKNEVNMRKKAIKDPNFPDEILIKEFLDRKDDVKELDLKWKQPNVVKFLKFTTKFLQWEELYAFEKILPILTRWQCKNPELLKKEDSLKGVLIPDRIKKVRNPKGVPSYEIIWSDSGECFKGLVPESQILADNVDLEKLWSTIEPQNLVDKAYCQLVEDFKQSKIKPKKPSKRKKKENCNIDEIADRLGNVSITEPKPKKTRKPRAGAVKKTVASSVEAGVEQLKIVDGTQKTSEFCPNENPQIANKQTNAIKSKIRTLDGFVKKAVTNSYNQRTNEICFSDEQNPDKNRKYIANPEIVEDGFLKATSSTPVKTMSIDFDMSSFGDESDLELSEIVDDIVSRQDLKNNLKLIADKYSQGLGDSAEVVCSDDGLQSKEFEVRRHCVDREGSGEEYEWKKEYKESTEARAGSNNYIREMKNNADEVKEGQNEVASFFISNPADDSDLFEKTFNDTFKNFRDSDSGSDTEEYDYKAKSNNVPVKDGRIVSPSSDDDSFDDDNYVRSKCSGVLL